MEPTYFIENAYSIYPKRMPASVAKSYQVDTPESGFEWQVFKLFYEGKTHLYHEEYNLAYDSFKELSYLILKTVHPQLPPDPNVNRYTLLPRFMELLSPIMSRAGEILRDAPVVKYNYPNTIVDVNKRLNADLEEKVSYLNDAGLRISSYHVNVEDYVDGALHAANDDNWKAALNNYTLALNTIPQTDNELRASVLHDMAIINEKLNNKDAAIQQGEESVRLFTAANSFEYQVHALKTLSGVLKRSDKPDESKRNLDLAEKIAKDRNLYKINFGSNLQQVNLDKPISDSLLRSIRPLASATQPTALADGPSVMEAVVDTPEFMTKAYLAAQPDTVQKSISINGVDKNMTIALSGDVAANMNAYFTSLSKTRDLGLLTGYFATPTQMVAYLPHMYFYVIPMAMADCEIGMGKYTTALGTLEEILKYPYLNIDAEVVSIWTKMADIIMELGDNAYKNARDEVESFNSAKTWYEKILLTDGGIDATSSLYKDPKFSTIKQRITNILAGPSQFITANGTTTLNENPAILYRLREAETMLFQIKSGLNFFGFDINYIPPFSFEYLQNTARYFAQHASQVEQKYIQYKSTAENEELRYDQMTQQVELASQTVVLEQRGVAEAEAGIKVSQENIDYAETRRKNAVDSVNEFNDVRWELLEYAEAEAWANASSVDRDDQVKLTWHGNYYNSNKKRRNQVIQDLAYEKTKITNQLQADKLEDEVAAASAFADVAKAQLDQAKARKAVAEKRVEIAMLQQKQAQENQEFLDLKEFGAGKWYDLAKQTKRLVARYLNLATEISVLMERAYNAETERGLNLINYEYAPPYSGILVGADNLLRDIDYFTYDFITNIKTKKAPVKKTISLSDFAPDAFEQLLTSGTCQFQTKLSDFDREFPGMYLCKIKNVELVFVGITRATSIAGTLRNIGVTKFKKSNGGTVARMYPADVMPLSQYDIRQDALAFRFDPKDLKLFENNGLETIWQLQLKRDANNFNFREILDIQLVIYYDGFFSAALESNVMAALPAQGSASRAISMQLYYPDELFYLLNNGEAVLDFNREMFPFNQMGLKRQTTTLKVLGEATSINGLTVEVGSKVMNQAIKVKTDANGKVAANAFNILAQQNMIDEWTVKVLEADNPQLVKDGKMDLSGLKDLIFLMEYTFNYQS